MKCTYSKFKPIFSNNRSSHFSNKSVLRNFAKFTGKPQCQGLFFNKIAGLRPTTLLKRRILHMCFPVNFSKFPISVFPIEHLRWLLLTEMETLKCCSDVHQWLNGTRSDCFWRTAQVQLSMVFGEYIVTCGGRFRKKQI